MKRSRGSQSDDVPLLNDLAGMLTDRHRVTVEVRPADLADGRGSSSAASV